MSGQGAECIGILAGAGSLPGEVVQSVASRGGSVHIVLIDGTVSDPALKDFPHTIVNWAQIGRVMRAFKQAGARDVLVLGAGARPSFRNARPDLTFFQELPGIVRLLNAGGDDAVLRGLVGVFARQGITVVGVGDVAPELLIGEGAQTKDLPASRDEADIARGFSLIAALGHYDIGQAAIVTDGRIEAIEGAEGTDRMLQRVAAARRKEGRSQREGVLVKRPKPGQDLRVDLPAIGPNTVKNADAAGISGIAVMAGHVLAAERVSMVKLAEERGIFIAGVNFRDSQARANEAPRGSSNIAALGTTRIGKRSAADIPRAVGIMSVLSAFGTGSGVVIDEGRVLAVGTDEKADDVIGRISSFRGRNTRRKGIVALAPSPPIDRAQVIAVDAQKLDGIVISPASLPANERQSIVQLGDKLGVFLASVDVTKSEDGTATGLAQPMTAASGPSTLKIFLIAGEHSGDALGGKLMRALNELRPSITYAGVGGEDMAREGFRSLFPIEDVAVMGPLSILPKLPKIMRRVYQTVDAGIAYRPDIVAIIDSPEFTHPIAKRIRKRAPHIPIVDYVSPSVWAWRPGRAKKMRAYVDHVLALLPFEPDAHARLGGPACTYVGHPLVEKLDEIRNADGAALAAKLGLDVDRPVLLVLPGSRTSEVTRLIDIFGETVRRVSETIGPIEVVIPAVRHVQQLIADKTKNWSPKPHIVDGAEHKYAAMRLAKAALAASGTVTLELAIAGTPSVVAYRTDNISGKLMFLIKVPSVVLANLVLGENVYPELLQDNCTPDKLTEALTPLFSDSDARKAQLDGLARVPDKLGLSVASPSLAAAATVLAVFDDHAAGKSRRAGPM